MSLAQASRDPTRLVLERSSFRFVPMEQAEGGRDEADVKKVEESPIESLVVTNTIPLGQKSSKCSKVEVVSVAEILGEAIKRVYFSKSVSSLFV